jgi:hypothetical protein
MSYRGLCAGLAITVLALPTGCSCWKHDKCAPGCPPPPGAAIAAPGGPVAPPPGAVVAPPAGSQYYGPPAINGYGR